MKCKKCGKDMQLRRYMDHDTYNPKSERFIYECSDCGVLDNPKKNIDYTKIYQKKREEILKDLLEFGLSFDKKGWVIRTELQKKLGISVNTIKSHIQKLKDEGLIEVFWEQSHPKFYLIRPINIPISKWFCILTSHF
jgi:biotin operon repressor